MADIKPNKHKVAYFKGMVEIAELCEKNGAFLYQNDRDLYCKEYGGKKVIRYLNMYKRCIVYVSDDKVYDKICKKIEGLAKSLALWAETKEEIGTPKKVTFEPYIMPSNISDASVYTDRSWSSKFLKKQDNFLIPLGFSGGKDPRDCFEISKYVNEYGVDAISSRIVCEKKGTYEHLLSVASVCDLHGCEGLRERRSTGEACRMSVYEVPRKATPSRKSVGFCITNNKNLQVLLKPKRMVRRSNSIYFHKKPLIEVVTRQQLCRYFIEDDA